MTTSLVPPRAPAPPADTVAPSGVRSPAYVLRVVSDFVGDLVLHQHFTEPDSISANADRAHLYFDGADDPLAAALAYAEQLDAATASDRATVHHHGRHHGIRIAGHVRGVETYLHVTTRVQVPSFPALDELRRLVDTDRETRAAGDEQLDETAGEH